MSDFARQQAEFQRGILDDDDTVLSEILDSPREKRETLFGVYRYAYGSRLVEAMRNDHELLHLYLGDEMFDEMGHAYVKACPSAHPNLRWFSQGLPAFLKSTEPYATHLELSDLAAHPGSTSRPMHLRSGSRSRTTKRRRMRSHWNNLRIS